MLSFIVYDWDGRNASEDDFLGSAHLILSQVRLILSENKPDFRTLETGQNTAVTRIDPSLMSST
jgi:hypothetical protein